MIAAACLVGGAGIERGVRCVRDPGRAHRRRLERIK
jgi:hypothetical protein